ncbi:Lnb N-terminal periplasmic domain-containing protein [Sulfitobacter sp.]|uniref:Lnb N-terminal periplasmic domain-containing protein n=1 Tax=Sulfitobacter sp. TaxID=1903071 RepID=UPI0030021F7A
MTFPTITVASVGRFLGHVLFYIVALAGFLWTLGAMSVHLSGTVLYATIAGLAIAVIIAVALRFRARRMGWLGLAAIAAIIGIWYQGITPALDRDWAFDVAHGVGAQVDGELVTLSNVRNFTWKNASQADQLWETRTVDLNKLQTVDMLTSVWDSPDIAHILISFGFADDQRVVFSVETRKESHEDFNLKGGFFRQFELVLIAATEEDIIKLRTNHRQEDVRLYPVKLNTEQRRDLFMSYVDLAQNMQSKAVFYNTVTANCTTTVYGLAQVIKPDMNLDWRLLLSGHLPSYVDALGGFDGDIPIEQRVQHASITEKTGSSDGDDFSIAIRRATTSP